MKPVRFVGSAKDDLAAFPKLCARPRGSGVVHDAGGRNPDDWKPMVGIGPGACEIRVGDSTGAYRVIYVAKFKDAVYVLHAFQKKSQKTTRADLDLAKQRYRIAREIAEGANHGKKDN